MADPRRWTAVLADGTRVAIEARHVPGEGWRAGCEGAPATGQRSEWAALHALALGMSEDGADVVEIVPEDNEPTRANLAARLAAAEAVAARLRGATRMLHALWSALHNRWSGEVNPRRTADDLRRADDDIARAAHAASDWLVEGDPLGTITDPLEAETVRRLGAERMTRDALAAGLAECERLRAAARGLLDAERAYEAATRAWQDAGSRRDLAATAAALHDTDVAVRTARAALAALVPDATE